jgi:adenine-specific DNA-methyltransferase
VRRFPKVPKLSQEQHEADEEQRPPERQPLAELGDKGGALAANTAGVHPVQRKPAELPVFEPHDSRAALCYIGSKHKLAKTIGELLLKEWPNLGELTLVDAFAGSGSFASRVGVLFRNIVVNDLELYSKLVMCALFAPPERLPDFSKVAPGASGYITASYCSERMYFTPENGRVIDAARRWIRDTVAEGPERDYALGCLLMAADRVSNTSSQYGAFLKKYKAVALKAMELVHPPRHPMAGKVTISQGDATSACMGASEDSLIYLDPPYTSRAYANNYFPLNVIATLDSEPALVGVTGIPVTGWNRSAWNKADTAERELRKIIKGTKARRIAMSYNTDGLLSVKRVVRAFADNGWECRVEYIEYARFKAQDMSDKDAKTTELCELLFLANKAE